LKTACTAKDNEMMVQPDYSVSTSQSRSPSTGPIALFDVQIIALPGLERSRWGLSRYLPTSAQEPTQMLSSDSETGKKKKDFYPRRIGYLVLILVSILLVE
jgi:hypothetical protein